MGISKKNYFTIIFVVILVFAFADAVNTILMSNASETDYPKFSIYFRGLFEIFIIIWLLFYRKFTIKEGLLLSLCFILSFSCIFAYWILSISTKDANFSAFFSLLNKTMFFFLCFIFINRALKKINLVQIKYVFKAYEFIIYINGICAILGLVFNLSLFKTYSTDRFGYIGFIPATNEASLFWLIALFYSFFIYKEEQKKLPLLFSIIACFLLGTKAAWIYVLISIIWFSYKFYPKMGKKIVVFSILGLGAFICIYYEKISEYLKTLEIFSYFVWRLDKTDTVSILLSGRDEFIHRFFNTLSYWSLPNYLFGGILMEGKNPIITEMDLFDIIMIFGFVGAMIFLFIYKLIFSQIHKSYRVMFSFLFFTMAFISGHVLWSALNAVYLCLFICKTKILNNEE